MGSHYSIFAHVYGLPAITVRLFMIEQYEKHFDKQEEGNGSEGDKGDASEE